MDVTPNRGEYLSLARSKSGQLFRKQILRKEQLVAPGGRIVDIDDEFLNTIIANFEAEVCDIVQFPLVDDDNHHSEDPDRNRGEVIGLEREGDALYAIIDVRVNPDAVGTTLLGASAMIDEDYTAQGKSVGPTLLHVAGTNRPHVTSLEPFEKLMALSADTGDQISLLAEMSPSPTTEPEHMEIDEVKNLLKTEHEIDLDALIALQTKVTDVDLDKLLADAASLPDAVAEKDKAEAALVALSKTLSDAGVLKLSADTAPDADALTNLVGTIATGYISLKDEVATLKLSATEAEVDGLISKGFILPAKRDTMIKLSNTDHAMFLDLVPEKPLIALSAELGTTGPQEADEAREMQAEVDRYVAMAAADGITVKSA